MEPASAHRASLANPGLPVLHTAAESTAERPTTLPRTKLALPGEIASETRNASAMPLPLAAKWTESPGEDLIR